MKITVLGAGGWGIAIAIAAERNGHNVTLWSPFFEEVQELRTTHENKEKLNGVHIPYSIAIENDIKAAENSDIIVLAVPSIAIRETAKHLASLKNVGVLVNLSKGMEEGSLLRLSQVIAEEVAAPVVVLSGPSHAEEVARDVPTSLVASGDNQRAVKCVVEAFSGAMLRIYTNDDTIGVELGGALKNVIAVAAGICDGLGLGDNTRAALITRGLTEIARLGVKMGAEKSTFAGLTGLGDLVVTCTSKHSRNHRFGKMIGQGVLVEEAHKAVGTVEGYFATKLAHQLAEKYFVDMPIVTQCYRILYENASVTDAVKTLMTRPQKDEQESLWFEI